MSESFLNGRVVLHAGDSRDVLKTLGSNSIDSIVTDPPYALVSIQRRFGKPGSAPAKGNDAYIRSSSGFMNVNWDTGETAFDPTFWAECLRVLKPGGHIVAFSGTRTYHRMACAIEDAGFEIRDQLQWVYGSGFPKSHDVSKGIDRAAGAEREVIGTTIAPRKALDANPEGGSKYRYQIGEINVTAPATASALQWQGWGTALKPACEPICFARKPLAEKTVAANVLAHGVGAINIDGCRIGTDEVLQLGKTGLASEKFFTKGIAPQIEKHQHDLGRWPANLLLSVPENEYELKPFTSTEHKRELYRWLSENA